MIIGTVDYTAGTFTGTYNSVVGNAEKEYLLWGRFGANNTLGWTVSWTNQYTPSGKSTTAWSGQMQLVSQTPISQPLPTIITTWLLTEETSPEDNWSSTNVSMDTFLLGEPPSNERIHLAKQMNKCSHPKEAR